MNQGKFICSVKLDLFRENGERFTVPHLGQPVEIPEWVQKDPFFTYLINLGAIKPVDEAAADASNLTQEPSEAFGVDNAATVELEAPEAPKKARKRKADEA